MPGGCEIDFFVDFEFKSRLLQQVIEMLFREAVRRMVAAFETARTSSTAPPPTPQASRRISLGAPASSRAC